MKVCPTLAPSVTLLLSKGGGELTLGSCSTQLFCGHSETLLSPGMAYGEGSVLACLAMGLQSPTGKEGSRHEGWVQCLWAVLVALSSRDVEESQLSFKAEDN